MGFAGVETWIFDLDNTLYPMGAEIYDVVGARMTGYIANALNLDAKSAERMREDYFDRYGATLAGLILHHDIDGRDFLDRVHDVDLSIVSPDPALAALIAALPGRRLVFTNGARSYAERILDQLGLANLFEDVFDLEASNFAPKPQPAAFDALIRRYALTPHTCLFFEDSARNLETAHALGFRTVLIDASWLPGESFPAHIHHVTENLAGFLRESVLPGLRAP